MNQNTNIPPVPQEKKSDQWVVGACLSIAGLICLVISNIAGLFLVPSLILSIAGVSIVYRSFVMEKNVIYASVVSIVAVILVVVQLLSSVLNGIQIWNYERQSYRGYWQNDYFDRDSYFEEPIWD